MQPRSTLATGVPARRVELAVKVIRADGTVEDHGTVARWHRNPLVRAWWRLTS